MYVPELIKPHKDDSSLSSSADLTTTFRANITETLNPSPTILPDAPVSNGVNEVLKLQDPEVEDRNLSNHPAEVSSTPNVATPKPVSSNVIGRNTESALINTGSATKATGPQGSPLVVSGVPDHQQVINDFSNSDPRASSIAPITSVDQSSLLFTSSVHHQNGQQGGISW